jgi:uncharacterized membrane protein (DUF106 family)
MLFRFIRALVFSCFIGLVLQVLAGYINKVVMPTAEIYSVYHLVAAFAWGAIVVYLYKKGLDYNELKEDRHDQVPR